MRVVLRLQVIIFVAGASGLYAWFVEFGSATAENRTSSISALGLPTGHLVPAARPEQVLRASMPTGVLIEPASIDFFAPFQVNTSPPPLQPKPVVAALSGSEPFAVIPLPLQAYRFLGRLSDLDGVALTYLTDRRTSIAAKVGLTLDNGYTIEAIDAQQVTLRYPPADAVVTIPLPPEQPDSQGAPRGP